MSESSTGGGSGSTTNGTKTTATSTSTTSTSTSTTAGGTTQGATEYPDEACRGCAEGQVCIARETWNPIGECGYYGPVFMCEPLPAACAGASPPICGEYDCVFALCGTINCQPNCTESGPAGIACPSPHPPTDAKAPCSIGEQDCPAGFKCAPWYSDTTSFWTVSCVPLESEPGKPGEPCEEWTVHEVSVDSCEASSVCHAGLCAQYCEKGAGDCADGFFCKSHSQTLDTALCIEKCDPLVQDCPAGQSCLPNAQAASCFPDASGDSGAPGDPCEYYNTCAPGLACGSQVQVEGCETEGCCTPLCDTAAPNTCPGAMEECLPWWDEGEADEGYENVGACVIPP